jgi:hypothetical protein
VERGVPWGKDLGGQADGRTGGQQAERTQRRSDSATA